MVMQSTLVRSLGSDLHDNLNQKFLCDQDSKKLEKMLGLDSVQKKKRSALLQQFDTLSNNRQHIEDMIQRNQQLIHQSTSPSPPITLSLDTSDHKKDDINSMMALMASLRESSPLQQIQPLSDEEVNFRLHRDNSVLTSTMNTNSNMKSDEEGGTEDSNGTETKFDVLGARTSNAMKSRKSMKSKSSKSGKAMQTSISPGEDDYGSNMDDLLPVDFYSDYMEKKKQLDSVVPKLAQINAQLAKKERMLEKEERRLRVEQEKLQMDAERLRQQQKDIEADADDIEKQYGELEALRDDFEKETQDWAARRDAVKHHIATARAKLEEMTRKLIEVWCGGWDVIL